VLIFFQDEVKCIEQLLLLERFMVWLKKLIKLYISFYGVLVCHFKITMPFSWLGVRTVQKVSDVWTHQMNHRMVVQYSSGNWGSVVQWLSWQATFGQGLVFLVIYLNILEILLIIVSVEDAH
jgi:hypothetical protein